MRRIEGWPRAAAACVGLAVILGVAPAAFAQQAAVPSITTPGEASIKRAPDRAWVTVSTDARAPKSADARRIGAQAMTDVQTALKGTGVTPEAIRTVAYSLQPDMSYDNGHATVVGYIAHNEIEVRVDDLDKLPDVIDAANTPKNVSLSINGPRYDLKDRETVERQVLSLAVENALARARAIAEGARMTLGGIQHIENESAPSAVPMVRMQSAAVAGGRGTPTPISPGEIEIEARVQVTIAIR
jgi:uncharacterized protein YggE